MRELKLSFSEQVFLLFTTSFYISVHFSDIWKRLQKSFGEYGIPTFTSTASKKWKVILATNKAAKRIYSFLHHSKQRSVVNKACNKKTKKSTFMCFLHYYVLDIRYHCIQKTLNFCRNVAATAQNHLSALYRRESTNQ